MFMATDFTILSPVEAATDTLEGLFFKPNPLVLLAEEFPSLY